jgi:beta-lactamase class A
MEKGLTRALALALLLSAPAAAADLSPKEAVLWERLKARIEAVERGLDGVLGVSVRDLKTGATFELRGHEVFPTASSIKVAILYELFLEAEEGKIDLAEVTRPPLPRVRGGGVLMELGDRVSLTWRRLDGLGLPVTRLRRRMMDLPAARRGDENVSTPGELRVLMETLYKGAGLASARAKDALKVAAIPKASEFRSPLPEDLVIADKPGELEGVRCVTAVVDLPGRPYAAAVMTTYLRRDKDGEAAIREVSAALYETFSRLARASEYGRIISEK